MPMFEYRCAECGHVTEFLETADARGTHACEECGSKKTEKAISAFSARMAPTAGPAPKCASCESRGSCPMA